MVIAEEWPYVYVVSNSARSQICHYCFKNCKNLRCSRCQFAYYCDSKCQSSAWNDHRRECERLTAISPKIPPETVRLIARIIFKHKNLIGNSNKGRTYDSLLSHRDKIAGDALKSEHFTSICYVLKEYLGSDEETTASEILEIYGKININCFCIFNDDMNVIGSGLYIKLSELNHSCSPNCVVVFDGPKAILNSISENKGKSLPFDANELNISYIELLATTAERRMQLETQYYFLCDCTTCKDRESDALKTGFKCVDKSCDGICARIKESDLTVLCRQCGTVFDNVDEAERMANLIKWELENLEKLSKNGDYNSLYRKALELYKKDSDENYDDDDDNNRLLHNCNIYRIRLLDKLYDACVELEKFDEAEKFISQTIKGYTMFYPQFHPSVGLQLLKLRKLQLYLEHISEAETILEQAKSILAVSHTPKHSVYVLAEQLIGQCKEERGVRLNRKQLADYYE